MLLQITNVKSYYKGWLVRGFLYMGHFPAQVEKKPWGLLVWAPVDAMQIVFLQAQNYIFCTT